MSKKISLFTAVLMIMNIMIGSGILIGPAVMTSVAGNASFLGWFVAAFLFLPIVLCILALNQRFPGSGGFYSYAKEGLGEHAGLISGLIYVVGYTLAATVEALALHQMAHKLNLAPALTSSPALFCALLVGVCTLLNMLAITTFGRIINSMTISKLLPIFILILLIPFVFAYPFVITGQEISLIPFSIFPMAIFGYFGFEYCCGMSHLIENSKKNAPRAMLIGFLGTALLYALFHFGLLNLMGAENLVKYGAAGFAQYITLPIPYLTEVLSFLIPLASLITLFAAMNGMINVNALIIHAMAEESKSGAVAWMRPLSKVGRPWVTILLEAGIVLFLAISVPNVNFMAGLTNVVILASFVLPLISLWILQRKENAKPVSFLLTVTALLVVAGLTGYSLYSLFV